MVLQNLLLIAGGLDNVKQIEKVCGRSNGAPESVAECLPRFVILRRLGATEACALAGALCGRRVGNKCPSPLPLTQPNNTISITININTHFDINSNVKFNINTAIPTATSTSTSTRRALFKVNSHG